MYTVWIRIDETTPWIELKGEYPTPKQARTAAKQTLTKAKVRIVNLPKKQNH
jgi:hypothetical protein